MTCIAFFLIKINFEDQEVKEDRNFENNSVTEELQKHKWDMTLGHT